MTFNYFMTLLRTSLSKQADFKLYLERIVNFLVGFNRMCEL